MDISEYTNYPDLYNELELAKYNCALWHRHLPGIDPLFTNDILKIIKQKKSWQTADKIFIIGQESTNNHLIDVDPRIHVWHPIIGNNHDRLHSNMFWLEWPTYSNRDAGIIDKLTDPRDAKPKFYFDALLGRPRVHRNMIYKNINDNSLQQKIFLSYFGIDDTWHPGHDYDQHITCPMKNQGSQFQVIYNGQPGALGSIYLPWKIFNQSWFSIVAETMTTAYLPSEKTAKPLLAKRLFVFFGSHNALKFLRNLGFKTFDSVIDESYDNEPNDQQRWALAFEQVKYLCEQDPVEIYQKILPVLEHNQQLILNTNWFNLMKEEILTVARQKMVPAVRLELTQER